MATEGRTNNRGIFMRTVAAVWHGLDRLRRLLHLILLVGLFIVLLAGMLGGRVIVPGAAALVIAPNGALVDQLSGDPLERAIARARGAPLQETLLRDVVDALRAARSDNRIKTVVLRLDGLTGAGLSKLQELADEITEFKKSGKQVTAVGDGFTRDQYYLAAQADRIYMHPMGLVLIDGYARFLPYYKTLLDKVYVDYDHWTVGEYKSFVEPGTRDDMSPEDEEASRAYLDALWGAYQTDVTAARKLPDAALQRYADEIGDLLKGVGGDTGKLALDYGLVDELLTRDGVRDRVRTMLGENTDAVPGDEFTGIGFEEYLAAVRATTAPALDANKVAVIVASGTILDGRQPPGAIGGDSTADLIRAAASDDGVKALVLRVDSGGGSAFASDVILRELEVFQQSDRPVVVSMGSVAASGGYWISMAADEIWASPTTLTGSIGVGATAMTFPRLLDRLGVHVDGVGTTELAGAFDASRALSGGVRELLQQTVEYTYTQFVGKIAEYRERPVEEIDRAARGRVWIGTDALERGLVDRLGNLPAAIESAAELAGLEDGSYHTQYYEQQLGLAEQLMLSLTAQTAPLVDAVLGDARWSAKVSSWLETAMEPLAFVDRLNDPRGVYAYCFCDTR
jgi:protease IV